MRKKVEIHGIFKRNDADNALSAFENVPDPYDHPRLAWLWNSPIYQRRYLETREGRTGRRPETEDTITAIVTYFVMFLVGVVVTTGLFGGVTLITGGSLSWRFLSLPWPLILVLSIQFPAVLLYFRDFLTGTPLHLQRIVDPDHTDPILACPLTDEEIFFAESYAGIVVRSGVQIGPGVLLIVGVPVGILTLILIAMHLMIPDLSTVFATLAYVSIAVLAVGCLGLLIPAITIFSSCIYAMILPIAQAVGAAILHTALLLCCGILLGFGTAMLLWPSRSPGVSLLGEPGQLLLATLVAFSILSFGTYLSARIGLAVFKRLRRRA